MPYEEAEALILSIKRKLDAAHPTDFMALTDDLRRVDFTLIGKLIQTYCFADLNARRVIDDIRGLTGGVQNGAHLNDTDVLIHLKVVASTLPSWGCRDGLIKAATTIEMHRTLRHCFAHWAVRRIKQHDVFIVMTKNGPEAKRRDGIEICADEFKYGLVPLEPMKAEMEKLVTDAKYIAESAAYIEQNLGKLRDHLTARVVKPG
jgi:hypothetical protein